MSCGQTKTVVIGTVGAGYAAYLHGNGYEKVNGVSVRLKTVCDLNLHPTVSGTCRRTLFQKSEKPLQDIG